MDEVKRKWQGQKRVFRVYTREEADELKLSYVPWNESVGGGLALTDDGYVCDCLGRVEYTGRGKKPITLVTTAIGRQWVTKNKRLEYGPRKMTGNYTQVGTKSWVEQEAMRNRTKLVVQMYVKMLLNKRVDWDVLGHAYRPDQRVPAATIRRLFKQERIKQMIDAELEKQLKEKGMGTDWVLDVIKEAYEVAKTKMDPSNMLRAAENLIDIHGMKKQEQKSQGSMAEFGLTPALEKSIFDAAAELPAHEAVVMEEENEA